MPPPDSITLHQARRELVVHFADGVTLAIAFDRLRDLSPAAGAAPPSPSRGIAVTRIDPVGNYAIRPTFSDGHNAGIYSWDFLHHLARTSHTCPAP